MASEKAGFRGIKSIASAALIGLGMYILYQSLSGAATCLKNALSENGSAALGVGPAAILAFSKVPQLFAVAHHRFVPGFIEQALLSLWTLPVVKTGTILSGDMYINDFHAIQKKFRSLSIWLRPVRRYSSGKTTSNLIRRQNNAMHGHS